MGTGFLVRYLSKAKGSFQVSTPDAVSHGMPAAFNASMDERHESGKHATHMPRPWSRSDSNNTQLYGTWG